VQISKSEYMQFLKHPIYLWLKKYDKSKLPPVDDGLQALFESGRLFESYAEKLFTNTLKLGFEGFSQYSALTKKTSDAIEKIGANASTINPQTLLQARFETYIKDASLTCICDAIVFSDVDEIDLFEIKAGTRVKRENYYDLAFQKAVLDSCGFKVRNIFVINANGQYVRNGDININEFCIKTNVTQEVNKLIEFTLEQIDLANKCISKKTMPELEVPHIDDGVDALNSWLELYGIFNDMKNGSIFDLCWPKNRIAQLYDLGVESLDEIEDEFDLTTKQSLQVKSLKENKQIIDKNEIKYFLDEFVFPLYFLDYETAMSVIPPFEGTSPYQQIPFQFSLHILDTPDSELRHVMYLHRENSDSTYELSQQLLKQIGDTGSIVTWNANFEKSCNTKMGLIHEEFKDFYDLLNDRVVDLADPFQKNWFVDHRFLGSYSIKKVLPVLVPHLSYKDLGINEGLAAQRKWMQAVLENRFTKDVRQQILDDLEKYCELDTLAMVEIYRFLKTVID
jgi:hypothetical protein